MAEAAPQTRSRPLSPFLFPPTGTYRWQLTSAMSILHRVTGVALANGDEIPAKPVASGVDAHVTFERLLDASAQLPPDFREAIARRRVELAA